MAALEADQQVYFVAETKSMLDEQLRHDVVDIKIKYGRRHFALFTGGGMTYNVVTSVHPRFGNYNV